MSKLLVSALAAIAVCLFADCNRSSGKTQVSEFVNVLPKESVPAEVQILLYCYPESVVSYNSGYVFFADGDSLLFDDGVDKSFEQMLDNPDICDMFAIPYSQDDSHPKYLQDPGRIRCEAFFKKVYGDTESAVRSNLEKVEWFDGQKLWFNRINGAADSLKSVYAELKENSKDFRSYLSGASTFYWRKVRGAGRLSPHSYGIAIDINTKYSNYWRWSYPKAKEQDQIEYMNRIPQEIVAIFEKHGFISGTRWYHFDTMHFEFRPELLYDSSH